MSNLFRNLKDVRNILQLAGLGAVLAVGLAARAVAPEQVSGLLAGGVVGVAILVIILAYAQLKAIQRKSQVGYILSVTSMVLIFMVVVLLISTHHPGIPGAVKVS